MLQCPRNIARKFIYSGVFLAASLAPAFAADPTGDWKVEDGVANIRIAECNGRMWGAVAWEKTPGGLDRNNPDASKQSRPTLGMPILINMKRNSTGEKWEGEVYNAKDGKTYESSIRVSAPDKLEIQGCVLGFLCGGETWTRVSGPILSSPSNTKGAPGAKTATAKPPTPAPATATPTVPKPSAAPKTVGQKPGLPGQPADTVGDICLLPDIARFTH